jgi:hypothetical protein
MPANKSGDSKQALIISLVCSVVLCIILGVFVYLGYSEQENLRQAEAKAKTDKSAMEKNRDWYKFQAVLLRNYAGYPSKKDAQDLPVLRDKFDTNALTPETDEAADVAGLVKTLDGSLLWDPGLKKPKNSLAQEVARLTEELKNTRATLDKTTSDLKKAKADYDGLIATKESEVQEWKKKFDLAQANNVKDQQDRAKELETRLAEFSNTSKELADVKKQRESDVEDRDKKIKKQEKEGEDKEKQILKLKEKLTPPDLEKFSTPRGRVVRLDSKAEVAWIDLGSADNVRSQQNLTFSIFSSGQGGAEKVRKGALEVMEVQGPHSSMCRITQVVDPYRNPITPNDLLINPAWSPTVREHVAIAGIIDLTGEDHDSINEFMNTLKRQGTIIDAYLDLKDLTIKGDGMTIDTSYLILGKLPEFGERDIVRETKDDQTTDTRASRQFERKKDILDKISAMEADAKNKGVTIAPFQKFVALTGYQLPRSASITPGFSYETRQRETPAAEPKGNGKSSDKPAPKEEKKEEPDKDK